MRPVVTACAALLTMIMVTLSLAGPLRAQAPGTWVQIEALPTLPRAEDRAAAWSTLFPDVSGFRLSSGWYAIALGPYEQIEARQRLDALKRQGTIPDDSYLHDGSRYSQQFWPQGQDRPQVQPPRPAERPEPRPEAGVGSAAPAPGAIVVSPIDTLPAEVVPVDESPAEARRSEAALSADERRALQIALRFEGFYTSAIDGAFGPGTRNAMAAWQEARGHEATGVLTTRQREQLTGAYDAVLTSVGLAELRDNTAGISVQMPLALVAKGDYQPPFARYPAISGAVPEVILISQEGDARALAGLYDIIQTLELVPTTGPRERRDRGFTIEGRNASIVTHVEASLTSSGNIKGFMLVWPLNDEPRRQLVLSAMQESFLPLGGSVMGAGTGDLVDVDLIAGLEVRRPKLTRSGFYVDGRGHVLTSADAVGSCARITLDGEISARVLAEDSRLGVALLAPEMPLAPLGKARFMAGEPRLGAEIAVSGYAWSGRLGAPVVTFGRLADLRGLDGSGDVYRLDVTVTEGEAGAPVLDGTGKVAGLLLAPRAASGDSARQVLPENVVFALSAARLTGFLSAAGLTPETADLTGDLAPEALAGLARDISVPVACWE